VARLEWRQQGQEGREGERQGGEGLEQVERADASVQDGGGVVLAAAERLQLFAVEWIGGVADEEVDVLRD
jgi:hypothetical protein